MLPEKISGVDGPMFFLADTVDEDVRETTRGRLRVSGGHAAGYEHVDLSAAARRTRVAVTASENHSAGVCGERPPTCANPQVYHLFGG
jgi:lactate dehydrogenase-like 2-hydroxyacid dehydrogenase